MARTDVEMKSRESTRTKTGIASNERSRSGERNDDALPLSWYARDIEQRMGFRGGRFTRVNGLLAALIGLVLTVVFFAALLPIPQGWFSDMFMQRGFTPYLMVLLLFWSLTILFFKWRKLKFQQRTFGLDFVPDDPGFVLSATTVDQVLEKIHHAVDDPRHFVLLNRIQVALSNLRNLGRVTDVDEILRSQADWDQSGMETSYSLLRGFIWATPVLGFIGTVMGLSIAIGGFGEVLNRATDAADIAGSLKVVTGGLATAFETTLVALVFALGLQMLLTFMHKAEEEFLDDCGEYCQRQIVGRLRVMPFDIEDS